MDRQQRLDAVVAAIHSLAAHPRAQTLGDGLSAPMAQACLESSCARLDRASLDLASDVPGRPPTVAGVVAARGVFTAPLEWVALLAAAGSQVVLKAPAAAPHFGEAIAACFTAHGLEVRCTTARELPPVDALVAMGNDQTIAALAQRHPRARLSLHGHRFSLAVVAGAGAELAHQLALDALLYDGRGCFTPVAVLHTGPLDDAERLTTRLAEQLLAVSRRLPAGARDPLLGPEWRRRTGLARALGALRHDSPPATALLDPAHFEAAALPGFLPVHSVRDPAEIDALLTPWRPWLAACATDHRDPSALQRLGFERLCRPGALQEPTIPRRHGGREMLRPLMLLEL